MNRTLFVALAITGTMACGGADLDNDDSGTTSGSGASGSTSTTGSGNPTTSTGSGGATGEWVTLIESDWSMAPLDEGYWCATKTITEDMWVKAFRPIAPTGTHHTGVSILDSPQGPDSEFGCGPSLDGRSLFGSGVGTNDLTFPEGVAIKISAGDQIMLNLHLFNTSSSALDGVSGALVQLANPDEVTSEAEIVLAGTMNFSIPPGQQASASGSCQFGQDATVFTLFPHMHQLGSHMKATHNGTVLLDEPYSFTEQLNHLIDPVMVHAGDSIGVTCTWNNTTSNTVSFGDSSLQEMCFLGLYRYPASNQGWYCVN